MSIINRLKTSGGNTKPDKSANQDQNIEYLLDEVERIIIDSQKSIVEDQKELESELEQIKGEISEIQDQTNDNVEYEVSDLSSQVEKLDRRTRDLDDINLQDGLVRLEKQVKDNTQALARTFENLELSPHRQSKANLNSISENVLEKKTFTSKEFRELERKDRMKLVAQVINDHQPVGSFEILEKICGVHEDDLSSNTKVYRHLMSAIKKLKEEYGLNSRSARKSNTKSVSEYYFELDNKDQENTCFDQISSEKLDTMSVEERKKLLLELLKRKKKLTRKEMVSELTGKDIENIYSYDRSYKQLNTPIYNLLDDGELEKEGQHSDIKYKLAEKTSDQIEDISTLKKLDRKAQKKRISRVIPQHKYISTEEITQKLFGEQGGEILYLHKLLEELAEEWKLYRKEPENISEEELEGNTEIREDTDYWNRSVFY